MNAPTRLGAFAVAAALSLGAGWAVGALAGPEPDPDPPAHDQPHGQTPDVPETPTTAASTTASDHTHPTGSEPS